MPELFSITSLWTGPSDLLAVARSLPGEPLFYMERRGFAVVGAGCAAEIVTRGKDRFARASREALDLLASIRSRGETGADRVVLGGFAFGDETRCDPKWREFPPLRLIVPRLLCIKDGSTCRVTWTSPEGDDTALERICRTNGAVTNREPRLRRIPSPRDRDTWRRRVEYAGSQIAAKLLRKLVMARSVEFAASEEIDPAAIIAQARAARPDCFSFLISAGRTSFAGSTPELLVRLRGNDVDSGALAGSAPRSTDPDEDRRLGENLLASAKNQAEHRFVADEIRSVLARVADLEHAPRSPELASLPEAHHLFTRFRGRLRRRHSALELAGLLHPTPAVCGVPTSTARAIIERNEPERGWYTGGVGWMNADGSGEFAVALRSLLIEGSKLTAWAGAGIVEGSDADAEFDETEFKLGALLGSSDR